MRLTALTLVVLASSCSATPRAADPAVRPNNRPLPRNVLNTVVTDSQVFQAARLGKVYRFGPRGEFGQDVFIYPEENWPIPATQAKVYIETLEIDRRRGYFESFEVLLTQPVTFHSAIGELLGHEVVTKHRRKGRDGTSYFAVYPLGSDYVKFRLTRQGDQAVEEGRAFAAAWLAAYAGGE